MFVVVNEGYEWWTVLAAHPDRGQALDLAGQILRRVFAGRDRYGRSWMTIFRPADCAQPPPDIEGAALYWWWDALSVEERGDQDGDTLTVYEVLPTRCLLKERAKPGPLRQVRRGEGEGAP